jgi:hypothetical protein
MFKQETPNHFETIVKFFIVLAISTMVFILPFFLYSRYGGMGLVMYMVMVIMLSPSIAFTYKKFIYFRKNELKEAFLDKKIQIGLTVIFNAVVLFTIGFNTLIQTQDLLIFYLLCYAPTFLYYRKRLVPYSSVVFASILVSVLLLFNFYFINNLKEEKYRYFYNERDAVIYLENESYKEYKGMRMFLLDQRIQNQGTITYVLADGILGFRVVKEYRL